MAEGIQVGSAFFNVIPELSSDAGAEIGKGISSAMGKAGSTSGTSFGTNVLAGVKKFAAPVAAVFSAAAIGKFAKDSVGAFTGLAGQTKSLQRVMGGTAESVSGMAGAMKLSGMDADKASACLTIFSKKLQSASGDADKMAAMSSLLGASAYDATGNILPMADLLPQVADRFAGMEDGAQKTALACQLFGRSGTDMLPFLNKGADGISELTAKAKELGIVIDDDGISKFGQYRSAVREWNTALQGAQVTIGGALVPFITMGATALTDVFVPAIQSGSEMVSGFLDGVSSVIGDANLGEAFESIGSAFASAFPSDGGGAQGFGEAVGTAITGISDAVRGAEPLIHGAGVALNWVCQNMETIAPIALGVAAAFGALKVANTVSGPLKSIGKAISSIASKAITAAAGTSALAAAETAEGRAASGSVGQTLAMGAAILMIGGGVALAALGVGLLAQSAIALSNSGGAAVPILVGLGVGIAALMGICAALGPALTAGAVGMLAFGAAVALVGVGVLLASLGITLISTQLPTLSVYGMQGAAALAMLGMGAMALGAGAAIAGMGLLVCAAGLVAVSIPLAAIAAVVLVVAAGVMALGAGMLLCGAGALIAGIGLGMMGDAMPAIAENGAGAAVAIAAIGAAGLTAGIGIAAGAAALSPMADACKNIEGALQSSMNKMSEFGTVAQTAAMAAAASFMAGISTIQSSLSSMRLRLPRIEVGPLPHFSMRGEFNAQTGSVPTIDVNWYAKGGVFTNPALIGVGEAGDEAVLPLNSRTYGEIAKGINGSSSMSDEAMRKVEQMLAAIYEKIPKGLNPRDFARVTAKAVV